MSETVSRRRPVASAPTSDLATPDDVAEMVRHFYADVAQDDLLGPAFNTVASVDWSDHLPKLTSFWCRVLFGTTGYRGNPYASHAAVHERRPFTEDQFRRWLALFNETVDLGWVGPNAERVKALAANVAEVHSGQLLGRRIAVDGIAVDGATVGGVTVGGIAVDGVTVDGATVGGIAEG